MIILKLISLLLNFTIMPIAVGEMLTQKCAASINKRFIVKYLVGIFGQLSIFYFLCTILSVVQNYTRDRNPLRGSFVFLCVAYVMVMVAIVIWWFFEYDKSIDFAIKKLSKYQWIYTIIFMMVLAVQLYYATNYQVNENAYDDFDYVAASQSCIDNNVISVTSYKGDMPSTSAQRMAVSWQPYIAFLALTSGFPVATVCHTALNIILLLIAYLVYYFISTLIFDSYENRMIFLGLLAIAITFGYYSHYSITFRMLCTIWQGKAVLYVVALPLLMAYVMYMMSENVGYTNIFDYLPIFAISFGACSLTVMSILLIFVLDFVLIVTMSIRKKKIVGILSFIVCMLGPVLSIGIYYIFKVLENAGRNL